MENLKNGKCQSSHHFLSESPLELKGYLENGRKWKES